MKDIDDTLSLAYEQMQEDRDVIKGSYRKFSEQVCSLADYAVNGMNINKCLELLTKQTAQLLELAKIQQLRAKKDSKGLSEEDHELIYRQMNH